MKEVLPKIFLLLSFIPFIFSGCTTTPSVKQNAQQIEPETLFQYEGFSIRSPNSNGWYVIKKDERSILFDKPSPKYQYHTLRAVAWIINNKIFLTIEDLLTFAKANYGLTPNRHKNINKKISIERVNGVECVLYDYVMEDHGVPHSPGKIFEMLAKGYLCPHPDCPESYIIDINYSERFIQGVEPLQNNLESEQFLKSFSFKPLTNGCLTHQKTIESISEQYSSIISDAQQGDANAQYELGIMYGQGEGISQDYKQTFYWLSRAAEQGHVDAQNDLGMMYAKGVGISQDNKQAFYWFSMAAEQGDEKAQHNLGISYFNGVGISQDYKEAIYWLTKAAERGFNNSQIFLGRIYYTGEGVPMDYVKACAWLDLAGSQGSVEANAFNKNYIINKMSPEQIEECENLSKELYEKIYFQPKL